MQSNHSASAAFAPGKHYLIDFYEAKNLSEVDSISEVLQQAAAACGATVLNINLHSFGNNAGVTGVALLAESHISIHTWPERAYAAIDIFMCGDCDPEQALSPLAAYFSPGKINIGRHQRGNAQESAILTTQIKEDMHINSAKNIAQDAISINAPTNKIA